MRGRRVRATAVACYMAVNLPITEGSDVDRLTREAQEWRSKFLVLQNRSSKCKRGFAKLTQPVLREGTVSKPPSCGGSGNLLGAVISEGGRRFARARSVLQFAGFETLHFPAVFVNPKPPCVGYEGLRLASRNVWATIASSNTSMVVFEDDIILHKSFASQNSHEVTSAICTYIKAAHASGADLVYLGHLEAGNVKWGTHALWITPFAARFLLENTRECYTVSRGDGVDSQVVAGCRQKRLACLYAQPRKQRPMRFGAKHGFQGFFAQDRVNVSSYLHSKGDKGKDMHSIRQKSVWARR